MFLIPLIRQWGIKMTLPTMDSQDSVEEYKIYVLKFLFPQYILVLKQCLNLKVEVSNIINDFSKPICFW